MTTTVGATCLVSLPADDVVVVMRSSLSSADAADFTHTHVTKARLLWRGIQGGLSVVMATHVENLKKVTKFESDDKF